MFFVGIYGPKLIQVAQLSLLLPPQLCCSKEFPYPRRCSEGQGGRMRILPREAVGSGEGCHPFRCASEAIVARSITGCQFKKFGSHCLVFSFCMYCLKEGLHLTEIFLENTCSFTFTKSDLLNFLHKLKKYNTFLDYCYQQY